MRGIKVPQAPPRSARPPPRAGAIATFQAIENAGVSGWHKVRSTEVAAPTRRSGTARLISLIPKFRNRPLLPSPRRHRLLAAIVIETTPGLAPQPASLDIFRQQRTGPVLGVRQPVMQHVHDRKTGIEPDEIRQFQRPHRMVGPQL